MREFNWTEQILILSGFVGILTLGAILLFLLCYCTDWHSDDPSSGSNQNDATRSKRNQEQEADSPARRRLTALLASGKQTMVSTLRKNPNTNDVLLATAMSSVPLKEFGSKDNDIIVSIDQALYLNENQESSLKKECIVCETKSADITWKDLVCYAKTCVGVLVYKRQLQDKESIQLGELCSTGLKAISSGSNIAILPASSSPTSRADSALVPTLTDSQKR